MDEVKRDRRNLLIILTIAFFINMICIVIDVKNVEKKCVAFKGEEIIKDVFCYERNDKYYCKKDGKTFQVEEYNCDI